MAKQQFPLEVSRRLSAIDASIGTYNVRGAPFEPDEMLRLAAKIDRFYQTGATSDEQPALKAVKA
jgi:hypothetical protein